MSKTAKDQTLRTYSDKQKARCNPRRDVICWEKSQARMRNLTEKKRIFKSVLQKLQ